MSKRRPVWMFFQKNNDGSSTSTNFSLTTDIRMDIQTRSYLGTTAHFANATSFTLKSGIFGVYDLSKRHSSDYLADKLKEACFKWGISMSSVTAVVTDGTANMTKSVELAFGKKSSNSLL